MEFLRNYWWIILISAIAVAVLVVIIVVACKNKKANSNKKVTENKNAGLQKTQIVEEKPAETQEKTVKENSMNSTKKKETPSKKQEEKTNTQAKQTEKKKVATKTEAKTKTEDVKAKETTETKEVKAKAQKYIISYDKNEREWVVKKTGSARASKRFHTKQEALKYAEALSEKQNISMTVKKKDGKFQKQN